MPKTIATEQPAITEEEKEAPPFWFDDDDDSVLSDDETDLQAQTFCNAMAYMEDYTAPFGEAFWAPVLGDYCCNEETSDNFCGNSKRACQPLSDGDKMPTEPTHSLISSLDSMDEEDEEVKDEMHGTVDEENENVKDKLRVSKKVLRSFRHISKRRLDRSFPMQTQEKLPECTEKDFGKQEESAKWGKRFNMLGRRHKEEEGRETVECEWVEPTLEERKNKADQQHQLETESEENMDKEDEHETKEFQFAEEKNPPEKQVEPEVKKTPELPEQGSIEISASLYELSTEPEENMVKEGEHESKKFHLLEEMNPPEKQVESELKKTLEEPEQGSIEISASFCELRTEPEENMVKEDEHETKKFHLMEENNPPEKRVEPEVKKTLEEPERDSIEIPESLWEEFLQAVTQAEEEAAVAKDMHAMESDQNKSFDKSLQGKEVSEVVDDDKTKKLAPAIAEIGMKQPEIEVSEAELQLNDNHSEASVKDPMLAKEEPEKSNKEEEVFAEQVKASHEGPQPVDEETTSEPFDKQPKFTSEERDSFNEEHKNALVLTSKPVDEKTEDTKTEERVVDEPKIEKQDYIEDSAPLSYCGTDLSAICQWEESVEVRNDILSSEENKKQQESKQEPSKPRSVWKKAKDKSTGRYYYFNRMTRQSTWTKPSELKLETGMLPAVAESDILKEANEQGIEQEMPKPQNLWKKAKDPASGRYYYYNTFSRETSWTMPQKVQIETSILGSRTVPEDQVFEESDPSKTKVSGRKSLLHLLSRKSLIDEESLADRKPKQSWKAVWGSFQRTRKDFSNREVSK